MIHGTKNSNPDASARPAPRLIIDLAKIRSNYRALQALAPDAEVGAVVKANAYGLGALEVVPALAEAGCRTFYVAHTREGEEVRAALDGRDADIFVFNGFWESELAELRAAGLFPVINDLAQLEQLRAIAPDLPCALHLDTGMNRLGLDRDEANALLADPARLEGLDFRQVMSHLACADEPEHALNRDQLARFAALRTALPGIPASLANSAGIMLGRDYHFDVLRPGLALYGGAPVPGAASPFQPAVHIEAPILQLRTLKRGDTLGYGATFTADRPMQIATLAAGYADGLLWASANGGTGMIADTHVPILGRVSMDLIAVDLSDLEHVPAPGDAITFLGPVLEQIAEAAGTISYEYLVRLGMRFDREYRR